jgi:hypothetical protein
VFCAFAVLCGCASGQDKTPQNALQTDRPAGDMAADAFFDIVGSIFEGMFESAIGVDDKPAYQIKPDDSAAANLSKLKRMRDDGKISQREFDEERTRLVFK